MSRGSPMASKTTGIKIQELAKDFGVKSKDVVDFLKTLHIEKNTGASLDDGETELFIAAFTAANQIVNIEAYRTGKATLRSDRPVTAPSEKPAEKPAEKATGTTPAAQPQVTASGASAPKAEPKAAAASKTTETAASRPAEKKETPAHQEGASTRLDSRVTVSSGNRLSRTGAQNASAGQGNRPAAARPAQGQENRGKSGARGGQSASRPTPIDRDAIARRMAEFRERQEEEAKVAEEQRRAARAARAAAQEKAKEPTEPSANTPAYAAAVAAAAAKAQQPAAPAKEQPKKEYKPHVKQEPVDRFSRFASAPAQPEKKPEKKPKKEEPKEERRSRVIQPEGFVPTGEGEKVVVGSKTRIVDTRTTQIDLSRYDDRIDTRYGAATRRGEQSTSKQKLKKQDTRQQGKAARDKERAAQEKMRRMQMELARKKPLEISVPDEISVGELAVRMKKTSAEVVRKLMTMGVMASVNETIDFDTAYLVAEEFGVKVNREVVVTIEEKLFDEEQDSPDDLVERSPVVCVMGHVDHGKTSLLDAIRHTNVTTGEAGGITQHIGAYRVNINGKDITFLDTPGHEAFTAMRARGAQATDIAILVVAADDGIMPQTIEAINHAKAAGVDIIVAINKMDKPHANPDAVKQALTQYDLVPEEWGGDVICVPVSALTGQGIETLLESVLLVAEVKELKANPHRRAKGLIIESRLDRGRGPVATVLVQNGTLNTGDIVIAGTAVGRVRAMINDRGEQVKSAGPSVPVEIIGLSEVPSAGDEFNAVEDEKMARSLAEQRREKAKQEAFRANARVSLDDLFAQISEGAQTLNIVVKADVAGSVEAIKQSLLKLSNDEVKVSIIHSAVGGITEGDVMLASASNAIIVGFNVRPDKTALDRAEREGVDIRTYRVIYDCINEITAAMKGMLAPEFREVLLGHAEVRQTIRVPNVGTIAGCYVTDGKIARHAKIRIVRDGIVISEDEIASLRRFKDDQREVAQGYECGVGLTNFNDIKEGDVFEAFVMEEVARKS